MQMKKLENRKNDCVVIQNIISPYKTLLFNSIHKPISNFRVLYLAETENIREWKLEQDDLKFPYEVMFPGSLDNQNPWRVAIKTWKKLNEYCPKVVIIGGYILLAYWSALFWAKIHNKKAVIWVDSNEMD